jgi:hypothetical protein
MSDGTSNIQFFANVTSLLQAMDKAIRKNQETTDSLEKMAKTSKKGMSDAEKATAAAAREMDRFAKHTKEVNRTPLERYADEMLRLNKALKAGKIDLETFNRAVARSKIEMQQASHASNEAFGSSATSKLKTYVQGMAGLASVTSLFSSALAQAKEDALETMREYEALIEQRRNLLQIAEPGSQDQQTAEADSLAMTYGLTRKDAYELLTSSKNEGFESSVPFIARAISANIVTEQAASTVAGQVPALFPGAGLTPEQAMNMNLAAAGSSRLSFEGIAAGLPIAAETMSLQGSSPAEAMGVLGVLSKRFRSGETAGMRASMLAGKLSNDPRFEGKGLMGGVDMLSAMSDEERREFLKDDKETNAAYKVILQERASIMQRISEAEKAGSMAYGDDSLVSIAEKQAFDPSTREGRNWSAYIENNKSIAKRQVKSEENVAGYYSAESATNDQRASMEARGVNIVSRYGSRGAMALAQSMHATPEVVTAAGKVGEGGLAFWKGPTSVMETVVALKEAALSLVGASARQSEAAANLEAATSNVARQRDAAATVPE